MHLRETIKTLSYFLHLKSKQLLWRNNNKVLQLFTASIPRLSLRFSPTTGIPECGWGKFHFTHQHWLESHDFFSCGYGITKASLLIIYKQAKLRHGRHIHKYSWGWGLKNYMNDPLITVKFYSSHRHYYHHDITTHFTPSTLLIYSNSTGARREI